jgi:hypothetical protein
MEYFCQISCRFCRSLLNSQMWHAKNDEIICSKVCARFCCFKQSRGTVRLIIWSGYRDVNESLQKMLIKTLIRLFSELILYCSKFHSFIEIEYYFEWLVWEVRISHESLIVNWRKFRFSPHLGNFFRYCWSGKGVKKAIYLIFQQLSCEFLMCKFK